MLFIAKIWKYISVEKAIAMKNNQSCSLYDDTPDLHKKDRRIIKPRYEIENIFQHTKKDWYCFVQLWKSDIFAVEFLPPIYFA